MKAGLDEHAAPVIGGAEVAAFEERVDGGGGVGRKIGHRGGVFVEDSPDWRGGGLARAVTNADHPGSGSG